MAGTPRKNGTPTAVIDRAMAAGLQQASAGASEFEIEAPLTGEQEEMLLALCNVFGLSARAMLNAALRYALYFAAEQGAKVQSLREYPKRLQGRVTRFALTAETLSRVREAEAVERVAACTVAGLKLLHARTMKIKTPR